jgi:hypothetical protein
MIRHVSIMEVVMSISNALFIAAFAAVAALSGCKKAEAPPMPTTMQSPPTSGSVALPASKLPPSDATIPPQNPAPTAHANGDANAPAQNNPKQLGKSEESAAMPLSGQANNHSTPNPTDDKKN